MNARRIRIPAIGAAIAAFLALGSCSQKTEQSNAQAPVEQPVQRGPAPAPPVVAKTSPARAENMAQVHDSEIPPAPPVSREAQMLDDAAASGMTAHLPRSIDNSSDASNGTDNR